MTVFSQLRPFRTLVQEVKLRLGRLSESNEIHALSFIHFVRFAIVRRLPNGPRLRRPILLFESNYNGSFPDYIETFSETVPDEMRGFWGTSYGFPGPVPVTPFKQYIRDNQFDVDHYYCAYPESTTMIVSALALDPEHEAFHTQASRLQPDEFLAAYDRFVADHQAEL
jgi:hypothetical protein